MIGGDFGRRPSQTYDGRTELPALTVFSKALEFLKNYILSFLEKLPETPRQDLVRNILWVITVPAIWSPAARKFMKLGTCLLALRFTNVFARQPHLKQAYRKIVLS